VQVGGDLFVGCKGIIPVHRFRRFLPAGQGGQFEDRCLAWGPVGRLGRRSWFRWGWARWRGLPHLDVPKRSFVPGMLAVPQANSLRSVASTLALAVQ
jgi:hypothetical protein